MDAHNAPAEELRHLKRSMSDLLSLMALPAMWTGGDSSQVAGTLLDTLLGILHVEFVYLLLNDGNGGGSDMLRLAQSLGEILHASDVGKALAASFGSVVAQWPNAGRISIGAEQFSIASAPMGLQSEIGIVVAGSRRLDFGVETERLLLSVAANQAALALQEARLLDAQRRVASDLDHRVAEQTAELALANETLQREVAERRRTEEAIRAIELQSRMIVDNIPAGIATFEPTGEIVGANRQLLEYFGVPIEVVKRWATNDLGHPDDLAGVMKAFWGMIASGEGGSFITRLRRADGVYRWFEVRNLPLRSGDGDIVRWYGVLTDIDDRKHAEDAVAASERDLRLTLETIPAGIIVVSPDKGIIGANNQLLGYLGCSLEALKQWTTTDMVHPDDFDGTLNYFRSFMALGRQSQFETRIRRFDGVHRWFQVRNNPLRDSDGRIIRWYGLLTDIDDQKRAEEELRRSEASLNDAQRVTSVGSFAWLPDTDEVALSEELYRIFEFDRDVPATFQQCAAMIDPDDRSLFAEKVANARAGMSHEDVDIRLRMPDGRIKYLRTASRATHRTDGRELFTGTIQDITHRRLAEDAVNELRTELAHVSRVSTLGAMSASIAHEVNQPLSGIITNASTSLRMLALDPPNIEGARETARRTIRDGNRAAEVVTRLRALFSKRSETTESVDLNEATRDIVALSAGELRRNRVSVEFDFADDLSLVTGDRIQLQQVILNLLLNASDALSNIEDRPRRIILKTNQDEDGKVRLIVQDNGVGIDPTNATKFFDAFYTTKPNGMGIGLSVSRSIIEHHGGRIWASANDGPGASFSFSIPHAHNQAAPETAAYSAPRADPHPEGSTDA